MSWGYTYCKVFVKDNLPIEFPSAPGVNFDHMSNKTADDPTARRQERSVGFADPGDDFVLWPMFVDVYTDDDNDGDPAIVAVVGQLLRMLWDAGRPAVAACDFEDELLWSGGIARLARS